MIAAEFGALASATRIGTLPGEVVEAVKLRILDVLGAALAGYGIGTYLPLVPLMGETAGPEGATMWGSGERVALAPAALLNSFLSHCCYMEDGSRFTGGHPSCVVIPPVLALAEARHAGGADVIAAVAIGYEVFLRLGRAMYPSVVDRGFQSTAVLGGVSAAAACASLLRLSPEAAGHAVAIGATLGTGLKEALKSSALQPLQVARSAEGGLLAARLAAAGQEGAEAAIERGFLRGFADGAEPDAVCSGLGREFRIGETYLKRHGGCRGNHAPIDVVDAIFVEHGLVPGDIEHIDIAVDTVTLAAEIAAPRSGDEAQFSIAFAVAAFLVFGDASVHRYTDVALAHPALSDLMGRIRVAADPALDVGYPAMRAAEATVRLRDGRVLRGRVDNAKGEPEFPMSSEEVRAKFAALAGPVIGPEGAERVAGWVGHLEDEPDAFVLPRLLVAKGILTSSRTR